MRYRLLTTTQAVRDDGTAVPLGGSRLRALLTVLALRAGRTVPVGVLVGEVWDGEPPADEAGALQALVARLRRALGHGAVASDDGGYRLCADPDDVDLYRFERLAGEGTRALEAGDPVKAAALLEDALALWQGEVLADLPDRTALAARWEARHLEARRASLAAAVALGRAAEALPELAALCEEHPLDEPLQALRIRALRAAGRTAQALEAYEVVRRGLAEELGADPGPELRGLHAELLAAPEVSDPAPPAMEERGFGGGAPGAAQPQHPGNLRSRLTSFVGRERDIDTIRGDLGRARLVTLLGPGGAGKTRLSQEAAETVADTWPDGVWLAELAPVDDPSTVPEAVLAAVGARDSVLHGAGAEAMRAADRKSGDPLVRLTAHCAPRRMLILLDNCEHVIDAAARLAEELLARCPELTILATSREPLGVPGELLRPLEPLPQPTALRLFAERGAAAKAGFRIDDDPEAAAEICRRLDGLPLAIELAAARLRMLTPRQIADRLDDRFRLLTGGARTVLPRQQTLRAVVDWSWDLLDEVERTVLRRLSVFAGGCDLAAAEAVCGPGAMDGLGSLVDKSLVVAAPSGAGGTGMRYRLLETVGEYAAERLDENGERAEAERQHLVYFRELARTEDPKLRGRGQRDAIAVLELEYENLRTVLRRAVAAREEHEALCLVHALNWFWQMRGLRSESKHWSTVTSELGPDPFAEPVTPAPPIYERCTDSPPPMAPDLLVEARRGVRLIRLASSDQDTERWSSPTMQKMALGIRSAYRPGLPQTCRPPASMWFFAVLLTGGADDLREMIDATVNTCRELGYVWELGSALQTRANVLANRAEWAGEADQDAEESQAIYTELGDEWGVAEALSARGEAHERRGEYALAAADFREAVAYAERIGAKAQVDVLRIRLAGVMSEMGEGDAGEAILREVLAEGPSSGTEARPAGRLYLAMWLGRTGRTDEARLTLDELAADFAKGAFSVFDGFVVGLRAWLDSVDQNHESAWDLALQALDLADDPLTTMIAPQMPATYLRLVAGAMAAIGGTDRARTAAQLLGASDGLLPVGHVPDTMERENRARAESAARAVLGDAAYEAAYAEGGGLSKEEATALARRDR
ncbi:AfsR/SARP family transcriptional regulator [Streptomyces sp. NBC_01465]|uniref:AfsR/SARP family transcriptional regulator n=1 Tax=Streptomyces sp. NBC_01465 TaxID=2903878 RepID=UPI002E305827|nr:BTAD domain-containing putative transcriptional regulator [Streptomyces sp. NBC_01465]